MIEITRNTKETQIALSLEMAGSGKSEISTGIGFFDHMLTALSKHSLIDLKVACKGDLEVDGHHSVEDVGIVLGQALSKALYPVANIERYGDAVLVMDEARVMCALDICNRAFLDYDGPVRGMVGEFDVSLTEEFFRALAFNAGLTLHIQVQRGQNLHHIIEATFKAFAVALRRATATNPRIATPSTKGVL